MCVFLIFFFSCVNKKIQFAIIKHYKSPAYNIKYVIHSIKDGKYNSTISFIPFFKENSGWNFYNS